MACFGPGPSIPSRRRRRTATPPRAGYVRPELDADIVAAWAVHMTDRGLTTATEEELPEVASALGDLLWNTLYDGIRDPAGGS